MPDVLTHLLVGMSVSIVLNGRVRDERSMMIILGSVIVDIERPLRWLLDYYGGSGIYLTQGFHSLLGILLLSFVAASFIESEVVPHVRRMQYVFLGTCSHLIMDMTLYPWKEQGLYLLFPLKMPFSFNLFWPDFVFYPVIGIFILLLGICLNSIHAVLQKRHSRIALQKRFSVPSNLRLLMSYARYIIFNHGRAEVEG